MPSDEIIKVNSDTATCDLKVNRMDKSKPTILFENKDYSRSVTTDEIKKFERDLQTQKLHGVFISQKSPITYKQNFQIDIIDNLALKLKLLENTNEDEYSVSKEDMEDIIEEYRNFGTQKLQMMDTIKLVTKQLMEKMEDIQLPKLKKLFMKLGNIENDNDFKCTFCNCWSGRNKASLAAHIRGCKFNPKNKEINVSTNDEEPAQPIVVETIPSVVTEVSDKLKKTKKSK